jgi:hypothetical protein
MKKLFAVAVLLLPSLLVGQSALEGTWRTNMDQAKLSQKPYTFSISNGMYECSTCVPTIKVKADGTEQPVQGQAYDTLSVKADGQKSITLAGKKDGKPVFEQTRTVSDDGKTLDLKSTGYSKDGATTQSEVTFTRVANASTGAHPTSGSWKVNKVSESDAGTTATYKWNGDELTMSQPTGEGYTAKLDGKDYPFKGAYGIDTVSLKRINDHTIEVTQKRDGKATGTSRITISPDGKKMTEDYTSTLTGRKSTFYSEKQTMEASK